MTTEELYKTYADPDTPIFSMIMIFLSIAWLSLILATWAMDGCDQEPEEEAVGAAFTTNR